MRTHLIALVLLALGSSTVACANAQDDDVASEGAVSGTSIPTGTFDLYPDANHVPQTCDVYTELKLSADFKAVFTPGQRGQCTSVADYRPRTYTVSLSFADCGTRIFSGSSANGLVRITDYRDTTCHEAPAQIVVEETDSSGTVFTYYSARVQPPHEACTAVPKCDGQDPEVEELDLCALHDHCYTRSACGKTIICSSRPMLCTSPPACDPGHRPVSSALDCFPGGPCYQRTACGQTIWCTL